MDTFDKIKKIILEHLDVSEDDITPSADFMEDLGADSLDVAELIMSIEDEFNLEINEEELEGMRTIEDVVDYLDKL
ncbi:acyl carrier protein [Alkalibacter rhizosphaerae]|uniref:Acyl carrier protein n=1 Tax=Alkalibacter rhizosphaerae TaxID=2815577 RepID=A0A974XF59_9FIRM|nr:acyl carrier protein [Alkalibacter rhizosphaerae]QSX08729.1 acyl carrier protein [Alkalibacter rhizosphaerae]